ncbi:MAG TPA: aldo/keto reductase [Steroidobacteraceae bacterium]|nr:aldo/keto reductase [Steroidobacteraceae bacterium]
MKTVSLPGGDAVPVFGMGTWRMAENPARRAEEIATLRLGLNRGATLIDTAEMYGEGRAEQLVGEAIVGHRDEVFLVSKVYPHNATRTGVPRACERSLERLGTDRIDLYLLHWRGSIPLQETMDAFAALQRSGKIRHYGVSNFDLSDMEELSASSSGRAAQTDQLLYNLTRRGLEWDLLPWLRERHIPLMAYSPVEEGRLLRDTRLQKFARECERTPAQVALAWLCAQREVLVIPKTGSRERLLENLACLERPLDRAELSELDRLFPPPSAATPLEMI